MKEWEITFVDQKGIPNSLKLASDGRPSDEEAALAIRAHLFTVSKELDLNDFEGRTQAPTAKLLEEQHSVKITAIDEVP
jgi:hypothetical protein